MGRTLRPAGVEDSPVRLAVRLQGALQGVGFRPFVHALARDGGLTGWVLNSPEGVAIEVEGPRGALDVFLLRLQEELPPHAFIQSCEHSLLDPVGYGEFVIRPSAAGGERRALVLPDIAPCPDCLRELADPSDRRFRYPFINCTHCGPRFSIITALPYDRPNTSMAGFPLCPACAAEYGDPADRRFHAQPIACPACGPRLSLWNRDGAVVGEGEDALRAAAALVRDGGILALKGVGGFHLIVRADDEGAVRTLRDRKHREEKPFAVMLSSVAEAAAMCGVGPLERRALMSAEAPIVLLTVRPDAAGTLAPAVAPGNPLRGVLLPPSPLHVLILREVGAPVVATSGNLSEEPICTDEREALGRLGGVADAFLVHNRPIVRHADDSIVRIIGGREVVVRRARGMAPLPVPLPLEPPVPILGVGAHLKNTVAVSRGRNCFISQHIGDLSSAEAYDAFRAAVQDLSGMFGAAGAVACDMHPDYLSTTFARTLGLPVFPVQHHAAHVASCMAENGLDGACLGVSWDGTGYGTDGTVWGGEFFVYDRGSFRRIAALRRFRLPGGDRAVREPRRSALGMLVEMGPADALPEASGTGFASTELEQIGKMLRSGVNSPWTTSAGRLFDGAASLLGLRHVNSFEGQAAMMLEFAARTAAAAGAYSFPLVDAGGVVTVDWTGAISDLLRERDAGEPVSVCAARFHAGLAAAVVAVAVHAGLERVLLTGGCFQNGLLTEMTLNGLEGSGFRVYRQQRVPPNDGGIALGQVYAAALAAAQSPAVENL